MCVHECDMTVLHKLCHAYTMTKVVTVDVAGWVAVLGGLLCTGHLSIKHK